LKKKTHTVCPICYKNISACVYEDKGQVFMSKYCKQHGRFNYLVEKNAWVYKKLMNEKPLQPRASFSKMMIPVTHACNIECPMCYLPNRNTPDLSFRDIKNAILKFEGRLVRLSGGEPTMREDLTEIIEFINQQGKESSLVTNGLKLADRKYVKQLKDAGLTYVSLSFNGFSDDIYEKMSKGKLLKIKKQALRNLFKERVKVVLSVTLAKGINHKELKKIYRFYIRHKKSIHSLRIRTVVPVGRQTNRQEQFFLSEIIAMMAEVIGVSQKELVECYLRSGKHSPCTLNIELISLILNGLSPKGKPRSLMEKSRLLLLLLSKIGFNNTWNWLANKIKGKERFVIPVYLRMWYDKYRIDLDEITRCPSSHVVSNGSEIVPLCFGYAMNTSTLLL
jgi:uncharacterized radical SAM superfamily Fe-S cluster-containing enzyme